MVIFDSSTSNLSFLECSFLRYRLVLSTDFINAPLAKNFVNYYQIKAIRRSANKLYAQFLMKILIDNDMQMNKL